MTQPYGLPPEAIEGMALTSEQARALEAEVEQSPDDLAARTRLIGFYLLASAASLDAAWLGSRHVVWLIEHAPEAEVLATPLGVPMNEAWCAEAGVQWRRHIEAQPRNDRLIANAARFFGQVDRPFASQLRYRLQLIDPEKYADFSFDFEVPESASAPERRSLETLEQQLTEAKDSATRRC